ncbi:MAG TPA: sulfite exporter TauE/SafE family protein [Candidatus Binatia bacterium]
MPLDPTTIAVGAALLLAAFVKGTSGMGFPMIATPMVALLLDIQTAIVILIIPNLLMDATQIFRGRLSTEIFRRFKWLLVWTVVGVFFGTKVLVMLPVWILNLTLGVTILAFVAWSLFKVEFEVPPRMEKLLSPAVGLVGGFLNGMTNSAGPAPAIYLYSLRLPKVEFIKSIATIFIVTKLSQLAAVSTWNLFAPATLELSLEVTLLVLAGFYLGLKTQDRVNQETFNRALLVILFVIGAVFVWRALS